MKKQYVKKILEKYGRIYGVNHDDRINVLESIEEDSIRMGLEYDYLRKTLLASARKNDNAIITFAKKAIEAAIKTKNTFILSETHMFLGVYYRMNSKFEESFKHYISAVKCMPSARAYNNLADVYLLVGAYKEANDYLKKALELLDKKVVHSEYDLILYNTVYTNQAEVELMAGYFKEAIESATILVNSTRKSNDLIGEGYGLMILGAAEIKLKNYENAMDYLLQAEQIFLNSAETVHNQLKGYIEDIIFLEASCYYKQKLYHDSIDKLNQLTIDRLRNFELFIENYEALNDQETAYKIFQKLMAYLKEDTIVKKNRQIENFKIAVDSYKTEMKANEYELLYSNTKSISEIGKQIISAVKIDDVLQAINNHIGKIMDFNALTLGIIESNEIHFNWVIDNNERIDSFVVKIEDRNSFSSWVARNKKSIKINDALTLDEVKNYKEIPDINWYGNEMDSMIIVPIMVKEEVLGVISLQSQDRFKYNEYDLEVINMLASFIGIAMKNWKDTDALKDANEKLEQLSKTDALTGISNRHILSEIVEDLFKYDGSDSYNISVVMIDIDHFKEYNDTYGHVDGDKCIIEIVNVLRPFLDIGDNRMFRYGGDEFVAIVPFISDVDIKELLEKARYAVEELAFINKKSIVSEYVTCSFGYTTVKKGQKDYQRAFYLADEALYLAKAEGKNRIAYVQDEA